MKIFGRKHDGDRPAGGYDEAYLGLRKQVLSLSPDQLGLEAGSGPAVMALLMETGYPVAVATLVCVVDDTTSLYFSNGGGVIGAGAQPRVAEATRRLLRVCNQELAGLSPTSEPPPPEVGLTQFVAVPPDGLLAAVVPEKELGERAHALSPFYYAGQDVITQIRLLDEKSA